MGRARASAAPAKPGGEDDGTPTAGAAKLPLKPVAKSAMTRRLAAGSAKQVTEGTAWGIVGACCPSLCSTWCSTSHVAKSQALDEAITEAIRGARSISASLDNAQGYDA